MNCDAIFTDVDALNALDPVHENGTPRALQYGQRMSAMLQDFAPEASDVLRVVVRAQHLERWKILRSDFAEGKAGYHAWRKACAQHHAERLSEILLQHYASASTIERAASLVKKERFKTDDEAQTLEDVACLVFIRFEAESFFAKVEADKIPAIVQKTWAKMSEQGKAFALAQLSLCSINVKELLIRALEK